MIRTFALAATLAGLAAATPALAASPVKVSAEYTKSYTYCMDHGEAARGVTSAMITCIGEEYDRQDGRLNRAYGAAMANRNPAQKNVLRAAQRQWIKNRDATCLAQAQEAGGGSASGVVSNDCALTQTIRRAVWLEQRRRP